MGEPILFLRLEGPLQSWGSRARWDIRDTQRAPTKSGVVGLLGCALGLPMRNSRLEELDSGLRYGVRVEEPGHVLEDYHTVTGFLPTAGGGWRHSGVAVGTNLQRLKDDPNVEPATIVSRRSYIEDAAFLVGLAERPGHTGLLERCREALADPVWPMFLGRKACIPTRPVLDELTDRYVSLELALADPVDGHPWSHRGVRKPLRDIRRRAGVISAFVEVDPGSSGPGLHVRPEATKTNAMRQFGFITVKDLWIDVPETKGAEQ